MTDAAFVYKQTNKERGRSARGAYHKKGGSRSKKCSLPSDKLTEKQRKELNGKVETYNMNKPMTWIEFLGMPLDIQEEYLIGMIIDHEARSKDLAEMFGIVPHTLSKYLSTKFPNKSFWGKASPHSPSQAWLDFVASDETLPLEVSQPVEEEKFAPAASGSVKQGNMTEVSGELNMVRLEIESGRLKFRGWPHAIFEKALLALDPSETYKIEIYFEKEVN